MSDSPGTIRKALPPVYGPVLPPLFDEPAVVEPRATCDQCQMCDHGNVPPELRAQYFRPDTKCCTYHPSLPNYLVGAVLDDARPELDEGKKRIRHEIARGLGVLPQRLAPSKKWVLLYKASMETSFGRSELLRCPYLDDKERCSIWHHRESVCATFYCKFDGGSAGAAYWKALKGYLGVVEDRLASWAAKQVSTEVKDPRDEGGGGDTLTLAELEERPDEAVHKRFWGTWTGREEEFYVACYRRVRDMTRDEFVKLVDATSMGRERLQTLKSAYERHRAVRTIPERVALNKKLRVLPVTDGVVLTMPYNAYDSIKIDPDLFDVLKTFEHDKTVGEVRKHLSDEQGIELEDALLTMFTVHDILVAPPPAGVCAPGRTLAGAGKRCRPRNMGPVVSL